MVEANDWQSNTPAELSDLRVKLNQMNGRIVSRLKDRSRFPVNLPVYETDAVEIEGVSGQSLLEFAIDGLEAYHSTLGRYDYPDQFPLRGNDLPDSKVKRLMEANNSQRLDIPITQDLLTFYKLFIEKHCEPGEDVDSFSQTAYVDADLTQLMHERVHIGRKVAEVKMKQDPTVIELSADKELLISKLKDQKREEDIIAKVRMLAEGYELSPEMAEDAFRWMIGETIDVEVDYIKQLAALRNGS